MNCCKNIKKSKILNISEDGNGNTSRRNNDDARNKKEDLPSELPSHKKIKTWGQELKELREVLRNSNLSSRQMPGETV